MANDDSQTAEVLAFPSNRRRNDAEPEPVRSEPRLRTLIGEVLREERQSQGRSLADVAERAAVSLPYLSEVERGRKEISSDLLAAVTESLDLPLDRVLERSLDRLRTQRSSGIQLRAA